MSKLAEYRALEQQLSEQLAELEAMKNDKRFNQEIEFERKLRQLMDGYGKSWAISFPFCSRRPGVPSC